MLGRLILVLMMGGIAVVHAQDPQAELLSCELNATAADGQILFQGLVTTKTEVAGRYSLEVAKAGPAGSVTSRQAGSFLSHPPTSNILGRTAISLETGAGYKAVLTIEAGGRSYSCEKIGSGAPT